MTKKRKRAKRTTKVTAAPLLFTEPAPEPLAMSIREAARMVGVSRTMFYTLYLNTGRVRPLMQGGHARAIDTQELRAAYEKLRDELRGEQPKKSATEVALGS